MQSMTILHLYTQHHQPAMCLRMRISSVQPFCKPQRTLPDGIIGSMPLTSSQVVAKVPKSIRLCRVGSHPQKQPERQQIEISLATSTSKGNLRASPCLDYYTPQLGARDRLPPRRTFDLKNQNVQVQVES